VTGVVFPAGFRLERLRREHPRKDFSSGEEAVDQWLTTKALQHQDKHLSTTRVLIDAAGHLAGYYTLAIGQVDFGDLPPDIARGLPRRALPIAILAWLGVSLSHQRQGLGRRLFAQALRDCHEAGSTFAFIAVVVDCLNESAKRFYQEWDLAELPGQPYRLFFSAKKLEALMQSK